MRGILGLPELWSAISRDFERELSQRGRLVTHLGMRRTHNRSQRFGGHTKHTFYCSCGRQVSGNGGKQHFRVEGHRRITQRSWWEQFGPASDRGGESAVACNRESPPGTAPKASNADSGRDS